MTIRKASSKEVLAYYSQTALINEIKSPNQHLKSNVFKASQTFDTELLELSVVMGGRKIAPFVRKNGTGILMDGTTERFDNVEAPNIRIKRNFEPSAKFQRRPGTVIFASKGQMDSGYAAYKRREWAYMADAITNAEEWLAAMALRSVVTYSVEDEETFTITFPRSASCNITLAIGWDDADPNAPTIEADVHQVKTVMADEVGLAPTDAYCGINAAAAFRKLMLKQSDRLNKLYVREGEIDLTQHFNRDGVIYLGTFHGVRFWQYNRKADLNGTNVPMIRDDYVEFVANTPEAEFVRYYGAIPEENGSEEILFVGERFAKSWTEKEPPVTIALAHSRPLCYCRRPGATVSMQVTNVP